ncbi:TetR/AcrR family transcriptional regulator [Sciscionella sediminilitoris]|uniref:TetR/AcrR family transcriptional regulator n=1 Tax=Sciscionella sediminilitoris TaxID=1445613 RepID=UPI0004DF5AA7|nr:TetR/AcrR family transcriptional regulator [Sciscionella sp. SE31]
MSRAEAKIRTRELLLDAAALTFARKGFHGATVEEIAEAAGFTIGALYANFGGKEQLFLELLSTRASSQIAAAEEMVREGAVTATDPLRAISQYLVDLADKDADFAPLQAEFWLYAVRNPHVLDTMAEQMREPHAALARLITESVDTHGVPPDTVATVVFALFQGLVRRRRVDPASTPPELFASALQWLFTGIEHTEGTA